MLSVPDKSILAGDDWGACTITLGTSVAGPPVEGTAIACQAEVQPLFDSGVSVADEPHANNKTAKDRTIAFGTSLRLGPDVSAA